jgi:hypothetical protein
MQRKSLSDILNGSGGNFNERWNSTEAAGEFGPVPRGVYVCHATKGELESSRSKSTPGYKVEFTILDGEFKGRKLWHDCWLTPAALPQSKRDLSKLGITSPAQMELPLPKWIRCNVTAVLRRDDDGIERNRVHNFTVLGVDPVEVDPFSLAPLPSGYGQPPAHTPPVTTIDNTGETPF